MHSDHISILLSLFTHLLLVYSKSTGTTTTVSSTAVASATTTPASKEFLVIIIDKEWTQYFIAGVPIIGVAIVLGSIYQFLWVPWWRAKMKEVEKEYNRLEKERLRAGGRA